MILLTISFIRKKAVAKLSPKKTHQKPPLHDPSHRGQGNPLIAALSANPPLARALGGALLTCLYPIQRVGARKEAKEDRRTERPP